VSPKLSVPLCIDGRMLGHSGTGVSTFARVLQLAQANLADRRGTLIASCAMLPPLFHAWGGGARPTTFRAEMDGTFTLTAPDVFRRAHVYFGISGKLLPVAPSLPFGIMHWTYPVPIFMEGWINIYAIHDVIPIKTPHLSNVSPARLERTLREIAKVADRITTISDASLSEIRSLDIFEPDRVSNASLALEPRTRPSALSRKFDDAAGLKEKEYMLFCGTVEERKNVHRIVAAYRQAKISMPLVIVGPMAKGGEEIEEAIRVTPGMVRLPYQTREDLDALVACARALIFPSLAEGFGLPVIEAMEMGTAVLASKIPAICEISGNAALLVDPTDVDEIAEGLRRLAFDPALVNMLVQRGSVQSSLYTVDRFAASMAAVYGAALSSHRVPLAG
jgi:glycosyltransferase involved in cell wall biosynthesis